MMHYTVQVVIYLLKAKETDMTKTLMYKSKKNFKPETTRLINTEDCLAGNVIRSYFEKSRLPYFTCEKIPSGPRLLLAYTLLITNFV
jgi:hypothetical protein